MTDFRADWGKIFTAMIDKKAVVVGDVMLDHFVRGTIARISPEAPIPILSFSDENLMPGGAANVARNLSRLGLKTTLLATTGKDEAAAKLQNALAQDHSIKFKPIIDKSRQTTTKTRFTAGQQILRVDYENAQPLAPNLGKKLLARLEAALKTADVLVLSDYNKGVITPDSAAAMIAMAKKLGIPTIIDPKKTKASVFAGADLITPNLNEFRQMMPDTNNKTLAKDAAEMATKQKIGAVLITLGKDGMMLCRPRHKPYHVQSIAQSIYDVSGAGDTVVATLAACLASGSTLEGATKIANDAAGVVVGKSGTATAVPGEIIAASAPHYHRSENDILAEVRSWQASGLSTGFTNGCFDLLHPGHLWLLEKAAATCDRLIVGVNSDASVRKLKGDGRPFQSAESRMSVLASLPMVSGVVIFDTPTPARLINKIKPDRLVKGGDYKAADVIGGKAVTKRGGKIIIIPLKGSYSTSRLSRS